MTNGNMLFNDPSPGEPELVSFPLFFQRAIKRL